MASVLSFRPTLLRSASRDSDNEPSPWNGQETPAWYARIQALMPWKKRKSPVRKMAHQLSQDDHIPPAARAVKPIGIAQKIDDAWWVNFRNALVTWEVCENPSKGGPREALMKIIARHIKRGDEFPSAREEAWRMTITKLATMGECSGVFHEFSGLYGEFSGRLKCSRMTSWADGSIGMHSVGSNCSEGTNELLELLASTEFDEEEDEGKGAAADAAADQRPPAISGRPSKRWTTAGSTPMPTSGDMPVSMRSSAGAEEERGGVAATVGAKPLEITAAGRRGRGKRKGSPKVAPARHSEELWRGSAKKAPWQRLLGVAPGKATRDALFDNDSVSTRSSTSRYVRSARNALFDTDSVSARSSASEYVRRARNEVRAERQGMPVEVGARRAPSKPAAGAAAAPKAFFTRQDGVRGMLEVRDSALLDTLSLSKVPDPEHGGVAYVLAEGLAAPYDEVVFYVQFDLARFTEDAADAWYAQHEERVLAFRRA
eukprot:CAMPEP_0118850426 /NCGR_PEP_ID=MMETSP1163-20130328/289_1 /TAXON_ID=124430 /ORGANISM="Phaeomonas parva, Strain CCMP2877" /LENGTH=486 /DNA_ID=CAMNT_0006782637 /DNA_START=227 /DNA_END=1687 /DNA_ORIENTATION=-